MKIIGLKKFNISKKELKKGNIELAVSVHLKYPKYKKWLKFRPKIRKMKIDSVLKKNFKLLKKTVRRRNIELIGEKSSPRGIKSKLNFNELKKLAKLEIIDSIYVNDIKGFELKKPKSEVKDKRFISAKAKVAIQIEGIKKGKQRYEYRILLIKAKKIKLAAKKLRREFKKYQEPYLNSDGRLVRWKLEKIIDFYDTTIMKSDDFNNKLGNEIFSMLRTRKLIPSLRWKKKWKK